MMSKGNSTAARIGRRFKSNAGGAVATQVLLGVCAVVSVVEVVAFVSRAALAERVLGGERVSQGVAGSADHFVDVSSGLVVVALVATGVMWLVWFHRAYANLPALGAGGLRFTSGWAVGAWLVPFLNLVRPKAMADDVWRASDPDAPAVQGDSWRLASVPALLHVWWVLWVGQFVLAVLVHHPDPHDLEGFRAYDRQQALFAVLRVAVAVTALFVVRAISTRQARRAAVLGLTRVTAPGFGAA